MKTGEYWFHFLTEKEQEEFKGNVSEHRFNYLMGNEEASFKYFISGAFTWDRTPQGFLYWNKISQRKVK